MTSPKSRPSWHSAIVVAAVAPIFAGCASGPVPTVAVVSMTTEQAATTDGLPPRNTVWRLDRQELEALGPIEPTPDPSPVQVQVLREPTYPAVVTPAFGYYDSGWRFGLGIGFGHDYAPYWPRYRSFRYHHR